MTATRQSFQAILAIVTLLLAAPALHAAVFYSHIYDLNNTFADSQGGPAMDTGGGTLGLTGYTYGLHQGPSLSNVINPTNYSIEMKFSLDTIGNFKDIVNFKNLTTDSGIYLWNGSRLYMADGDISIPPPFGDVTYTDHTPIHFVLTRDGTTREVKGYIDGALILTFTDIPAGKATFDAAGNIVQLLIDNVGLYEDPPLSGNFVMSAENPSGFLDYVRIYDGVLSGAQVTGLAGGATPQALGIVPEPASLALLGGSAACLLFRRRR